MPEWIASAEIRKIDINIPRYELKIAEKKLKGSLQLSSEGSSAKNGIQLDSSLHENQWGAVHVVAIFQTRQLQGPWHFISNVDLNLPKNSSLRATADLYYFQNRITAVLNGNVISGKAAQFNDCRLSLNIHDEQSILLSADCEVQVSLNQFQQQQLKVLTGGLRHPVAAIQLTSNLETAYPFETKNLIAGRMRVRPFNNFQNVLALRGGVSADFEFVMEDLPTFRSLDGKLNLVADVSDFERVVDLLEGTPLAIPAPFLVLEGPVRLLTQGTFNPQKARIDSRLLTELSSKYQRLVTLSEAHAEIALNNFRLRKVSVDSEINLRQVRLVLPPLETESPSQFFPDPRIVSKALPASVERAENARNKGLPLDYNILLRTPDEKPIRLVSSVTDRPVAFGIRLKLQDQTPYKGRVNLKPIHYNFLGVHGTTGGLHLKVRGNEYQTIARGTITNKEGAAQSEVLIAQDPTDSFVRPQPKLPIPLVELVTALGFKNPFSLVVLDQRRPNPPQTDSGFGTVPVEIQKRY